MALYIDYTTDMGKVVRRINGETCTINIHTCNALAAFIYHYEEQGRKMAFLMMFFADIDHMNNCLKEDGKLFGEGENIEGIELNIYYPNALKMLKVLTKHGYRVTAYYKAPSKTNNK